MLYCIFYIPKITKRICRGIIIVHKAYILVYRNEEVKKMKYDCIIIGKGPAGITAGIYLQRANKKVLIIGKDGRSIRENRENRKLLWI